jgi:hypothetical protein
MEFIRCKCERQFSIFVTYRVIGLIYIGRTRRDMKRGFTIPAH